MTFDPLVGRVPGLQTYGSVTLVIQGGMGVAVSPWRLASAVACAGQLGVVSGVALDTVLARRLQDLARRLQDGGLRIGEVPAGGQPTGQRRPGQTRVFQRG